MKPRQVFIACLSLAFFAMTIASHVSKSSTYGYSKTNVYHKTSNANPCKEVWENTTVSTPEGLVLCIVPTEEELLEQLKSVGGYNQHYVAVTFEEAEKFKPILPGWDGAATTKPSAKPSSWKCRRRRRMHPVFGKKRKGKRSADLKREIAGWQEDNDDVGVSQGTSDMKLMIDVERGKRVLNEEENESRRTKRSDDDGIRESIKVGCVAKGDPIKSLKQMCDTCQRRTELTADRFPRYINEVTCESASGSPTDETDYCKPLLGKCAQGIMLIDLLKRTDEYSETSPPSTMYFKALKQIWIPYTHSIRSCCECRSLI